MLCKTMFGALLLSSAASAQTTYLDALFRVEAPAGWQAAKLDNQPDGVSITKGKLYVNAGVGPGNAAGQSAKDILAGYEKGLGPQCQGFRALQRAETTLAGAPGSYLQFACNDPRAGSMTLSVTIATSKGDVLFFNTGGPAAEYAAAKTAFDAMAKSFRLNAGNSTPATAAPTAPGKSAGNPQQLAALQKACAAGVFTPEECAAKRKMLAGGGNPANDYVDYASAAPQAPAQTGGSSQVYRDPRGRFSVSVPPGWTAAPQGQGGDDGVQISQGSSWAILSPFSGAKQPGDVVNSLYGQFQQQYKNLKMVDHQPFQLGAHDAAYAMFTGVNPKGVEVSFVISGIHASGANYLAMISNTPVAEAEKVSQLFRDMSLSIRFAGE